MIALNCLWVPYLSSEKQKHSDIWNRQVKMENGKTYQIIAPSGSGKTTLSNILTFQNSDYQGNWSIDGVVAQTPIQKQQILQNQLSFVTQEMNLITHISAQDNIDTRAVLSAQGMTTSEQAENLARLGLQNKSQAITKTLSMGEKQRTLIIRSLASPFTWLILDEPFSHLDEMNTQRAAEMIRRRADQFQAGIIYMDLDDNSIFPDAIKLYM